MEKAGQRNLEMVLLEYLEKLLNIRISEDLKIELPNRVNISYQQYGDLIVPIDLERFKVFKKDFLGNMITLAVNEKVFSKIIYIPVISLQYITLSSFHIWTEIKNENKYDEFNQIKREWKFIDINEIYTVEGAYSFLLNSYSYNGKTTNNKLNFEKRLSHINVNKYDFDKYWSLIAYLLLSSISNYAYPPNILHDIGYTTYLGDKFSGFTGFSIYLAKIKFNRIYDKFDNKGYEKIKIFNKDLLTNGGKVYRTECSIYGPDGHAYPIQSNNIYLNWNIYNNLNKNQLEKPFYAIILRIYEIGSKLLTYDIVIGELKELLPAISFSGLRLDRFLSDIESDELYLLSSSLLDIKNKINKIDDRIPGSHLFGSFLQKYEYQKLSASVKEFINSLRGEDNINMYQISTFLHNKLLDNLKSETRNERRNRIAQYLYLLRNSREKLVKTPLVFS